MKLRISFPINSRFCFTGDLSPRCTALLTLGWVMLSILNVDLFPLRKYDIEILGQKITVMAIYQKVKQECDADKTD